MIAFKVYGFNLLCRGITIFLEPFVMPVCLLPVFEIQKPAFLKAFIARREEISVKSMKLNYANATSNSRTLAPLSSSFPISR